MDVFGSSGTRGVANDTITPDFVLQVAMAAGTEWDADRAAVARDTRTTGRMLADAAASGLASVGLDVDRLGIVPTPAAQAYAEAEGTPVVVVTASHNPPRFNGIKLIGDQGVELRIDDLERIEKTLIGEDFERANWDGTGDTRIVADAGERYRRGLFGHVDRERIADADLTVALDPGHGAGTLTSPEFFRELGCRVLTVNAQPDGRFPGREPEPVAENLEDLARLVRTTDADLGIAHDGDADRATFVDEDGAFVNGEASLAALAAARLDEGDVAVSAVNVSQRLVDVVNDAGARLELTPIGSSYIITRIRELAAAGESVAIAGEGNGGLFFPDYRLARDGAYTAAKFLELVAERPVSEVVAPFGGYHNVRINLEYEGKAERQAMLDAAERRAAASDAEVTDIDGHRLDYGDAWVLTRPSGTEPLVRVYAEAGEKARAGSLAEEMADALRTAADEV